MKFGKFEMDDFSFFAVIAVIVFLVSAVFIERGKTKRLEYESRPDTVYVVREELIR